MVWAEERKEIFQPIDEHVQAHCLSIMSDYPNLYNRTSTRSQGDPWVIATAMRFSCTVVTEEVAVFPKFTDSFEHVQKTKGHARIKIPDVCRCVRIPCVDIRGLMRAERWTL